MKYNYDKISRPLSYKGMKALKWLNKQGLKGWEFFSYYNGINTGKQVFHFRKKIKP